MYTCRLHQHADFWLNELDASSVVMDFVTKGYKLPFLNCFKLNHRSALEHRDFVSSIHELVDTNCVIISETCHVAHCQLWLMLK